MIEKMRLGPCTITIPPSKICTSGTKSQPLWISPIEDNPLAGVTFSSFLTPQSPSSLPTAPPRTLPCITVLVSSLPQPSPCPPLTLILVPCSLHQHLPSSYLLRHPRTPNSVDLWIFPGFPQDLPLHLTDTRLRVSPCFPSLASLVSPSSPHPCFSVTLYHLISLLSLIPCITINFFDSSSLCHRLLSYSLNSTMTHSP